MTEQILEVLTAAAVVLITRYLLPFLKTQLEKKKQETLITAVEQYVEAAEQLYKGVKRGNDRLCYVSRMLEADGVKVNGKVRAMIESAVLKCRRE